MYLKFYESDTRVLYYNYFDLGLYIQTADIHAQLRFFERLIYILTILSEKRVFFWSYGGMVYDVCTEPRVTVEKEVSSFTRTDFIHNKSTCFLPTLCSSESVCNLADKKIRYVSDLGPHIQVAWYILGENNHMQVAKGKKKI